MRPAAALPALTLAGLLALPASTYHPFGGVSDALPSPTISHTDKLLAYGGHDCDPQQRPDSIPTGAIQTRDLQITWREFNDAVSHATRGWWTVAFCYD